MLFSLLLAGLTGFFVWKKKWGLAVFSGMLFFYFLWSALLMLLNMIVVGRSIGF